jgi:Spy/CpxP family protein refolding chaperone
MKYLIALALVAWIWIPALAQTQPTPPTPAEIAKHQVKNLTALLSLTSAQQKQATNIYTDAAQSAQTVIESDKALHDSLKAAIKSNDLSAIDQVAASLAQSGAQLTSIKAKADAAVYQILTAAQQTKFTELESAHMGPFDGPGGPGGPPAMGFR